MFPIRPFPPLRLLSHICSAGVQPGAGMACSIKHSYRSVQADPEVRWPANVRAGLPAVLSVWYGVSGFAPGLGVN